MMNFIKRNLILIIGIPLGALGGFLYWHQIGCVTGTCPITSSPVNSTLYGALMGGVTFSIFKRDKGDKTQKEPDKENPQGS